MAQAMANVKASRTETDAELRAQVEALLAENARLQAQAHKAAKLTVKVSAKGGVSVYGMGRWPVTLYAEQWAKLFGIREEIEAFIDAHREALSFKA